MTEKLRYKFIRTSDLMELQSIVSQHVARGYSLFSFTLTPETEGDYEKYFAVMELK